MQWSIWRVEPRIILVKYFGEYTSIVNIVIDAARKHRIERSQLDLYVRYSLLLHNRALLHAKSFLYFMMPAQPPRRLRLAVQTSARFREAVLRSTQGRLYLHSALYRSRKIYLSAHLFSIDERPRVSEMKSGENFSRQQSRARK